jgi:hypothetical protein
VQHEIGHFGRRENARNAADEMGTSWLAGFFQHVSNHLRRAYIRDSVDL